MESDIPSKWNWKQAGIVMFIPEKTDFEQKPLRGHKEVHYIWIKGTAH
jgi:hypothetical protein